MNVVKSNKIYLLPMYSIKNAGFAIIVTCIFLLGIFSSFKSQNSGDTSAVKNKFISDLTDLYKRSEVLNAKIQEFDRSEKGLSELREKYYQVKNSYKKVEFLLEYLNPSIAKKLNGAPLPKILVEQEKYQTLKFAKPSFRVFPPEGLQALEEHLFADSLNSANMEAVRILAITVREQILLFKNGFNQDLTERLILESAREELIRIMTLGITGFDAPAAGKEIQFCAIALESVIFSIQQFEKYSDSEISSKSKEASKKLQETVNYLNEHQDFDSFDRLTFIREYADPSFALITKLQNIVCGSGASIARPVNRLSTGLFNKDFLQTSFYAKQDQRSANPEIQELGKLLFFDPLLSANNERSCASCHNPQKGFTDGVAKSIAFDFKGTVSRNSPTLLNAVFSNAYFWDSRAQYLQDQVPAVLLKADELHGNYEEVISKLSQSKEYVKLFEKAFSDETDNSININTINRSIAAYVQSLVALDSEFDKYMRGETGVLDASVKRGFNLFMGKAACGTCHFAPVFNGTVPPQYIESESEVLGVPDQADLKAARLDQDSGKAGIIPADVLVHAFKTPTIRNAAISAPYMHNGVFSALEDVMHFYNIGGGLSLGFDVPNQTLPADSLNLSENEIKDIVAFMNALTDTVSVSKAPVKLPAFKKKSALNTRLVGGRY